MDPLSLAGTLTSVITSFQRKYERYKRLQDTNNQSLVAFWKTVSRLTDDLCMYRKFIEDLHCQKAFASFIKSVDWDGFESALDDIQVKYLELQCHELSGSTPER